MTMIIVPNCWGWGQTIKTVGTSGADYPTLKGAFDAINAGTITGEIILQVVDNTTESATAVLNASGTGSAGYSSVLIYPTMAGKSISGTINGVLVKLNGADQVTFDGRVNQTGPKDLTIANASTGTSASTIQFIGDASNNTIQYCKIKGATKSTFSGVVFFSTGTATGNLANKIDYCDVSKDAAGSPFYLIFSSSVANKENVSVISNNNLFDNYAATGTTYAIYLSSYNLSWVITNNSIYQTATVASAGVTMGGIFISGGHSFSISGNYIGGGAPLAGNPAWSTTSGGAIKFIGMNLNVLTTTTSEISDNHIGNFSWTTSSGANSVTGVWTGMYILSGKVNIGTNGGNTIGSETGTGNIVINTTSSGNMAGSYGILTSTSGSGTLNISNNKIGSISVGNTTNSNGGGHRFYGILAQYGGFTIHNNKIGSATTSQSIHATNSQGIGATTTSQDVYGIYSTYTGPNPVVITSNTISNLHNSWMVSSSGNGLNRGIIVASAKGSVNISNNVIYSLTSNQPMSGAGLTMNLAGIFVNAVSSTGIVLSGNTIYSLGNLNPSAAVNIAGIYCNGPASGTNQVVKNLVHSFNLASSISTATIYGINVAAGTTSYQNNMIRLGIDANGNGNPNPNVIYGIYDGNGTNDYHHNSIFIGGTNVANTASSYAFYNNTSGNIRSFQNNLFVNNRSFASAGTEFNVACYISALPASGTISGLTSNHNVYFADGTGGVAIRNNSANYTLREWKDANYANFQDLNSGYGDPNFINPTGSISAGTFPLKVQGTTPAEGSGAEIPGVAEDIEGNARSSLSPVDIGADAGDYAPKDIFPPEFSYVPLGKTSSVANRTLSGATITDIGTGIPLSGSFIPRIWYKKNSGGTWVSNAGPFDSGSGNSGIWSFVLDYSVSGFGGAPTENDVIYYYLAAQDQADAPNNWYSPFTGASHTDVNAQTSAPDAPNSFTILHPFSGYIPVGSGQIYTSLTANAATGLFYAINNGMLTGNLTAAIVSDLNETGDIELNQWAEEGAGNYTLTIQSDGTSRTISGEKITVPLLSINGADNVLIDGLPDRKLLFRNTHGTPGLAMPTIRFDNGSASCTVTNCLIENNSSSVSSGAVLIGGNGTNNVTINFNEIRNPTGGTVNDYYRGIYSNGTSNTVTISGNSVYNWTTYGIHLGTSADGAIISDNSLYRTTAGDATAVCALAATGGSGHVISGNYIGGTEAQCGGNALTNTADVSFKGIDVSGIGAASATTITGNTIQNIDLQGAGNATFTGITTGGASSMGRISKNTVAGIFNASANPGGSYIVGMQLSNGSFTVDNNVISLSNGSNANPMAVYGIRDAAGSPQANNYYFNSIRIGGSQSSGNAVSSFAFYRSANTANVIKNNIFFNGRSSQGDFGKHYAIGYFNNSGTIDANQNDYFVNGTNGVLGQNSGSDVLSLPIVSGQDALSVSADPLFASSTDLQASAVELNNKGVAVPGIGTDRTGTLRGDPPDMGAYEFSKYATVATGSPITVISTTGATLNGTVMANNEVATGTYEYGTTAGYGSTASWAPNPVTGTNTTEVTAAISALTPNTTYHYRINATTPKGSVNGSDHTFTTNAAANCTFSGASSNAWELAGNWDNGIPAATTMVTIPANKTVVIASVAECNNLTIAPQGALTVTPGAGLEVNGNLLLQSDATGSGSIISRGTDLSLTGTATVERYFSGAPESWHLLSSPVSNQDISGEFTPTGTYPDGSGYDFYLWQESSQMWMNQKSATWTTANGGNGFTVGRGYMVAYQSANPIKSFTGTLNEGTINIPITNSGAGTYHQSNLVGNPYPSSIDWKSASGLNKDDLQTATGGGHNIYVYNQTANNYGVYNDAGLGDEGTNGTSRYIPPMQGFFVTAKTGAMGTGLGLANEARVHGSQPWLKNGDAKVCKLLVTAPQNAGKDEVVIEFGHPSDLGGAEKWFSFVNAAPTLYSEKAGEKYSISFLTTVDEHPEIPVAFKAGVDGTYALSAVFSSGFSSGILLEDLQTGKKADLGKSPDYLFNATTEDNPDRFVLRFFGAGEHEQPPAIDLVTVFARNHELVVISHTGQPMEGEVFVYNLMGELVGHQSLDRNSIARVEFHRTPGCYIVKLRMENRVIVRKIFIGI